MPVIKLNRINKGGEILLSSEHILFLEVESRTTTIHMTNNLLFSVQETPEAVASQIEQLETDRLFNAIQRSGLARPTA